MSQRPSKPLKPSFLAPIFFVVMLSCSLSTASAASHSARNTFIEECRRALEPYEGLVLDAKTMNGITLFDVPIEYGGMSNEPTQRAMTLIDADGSPHLYRARALFSSPDTSTIQSIYFRRDGTSNRNRMEKFLKAMKEQGNAPQRQGPLPYETKLLPGFLKDLEPGTFIEGTFGVKSDTMGSYNSFHKTGFYMGTVSNPSGQLYMAMVFLEPHKVIFPCYRLCSMAFVRFPENVDSISSVRRPNSLPSIEDATIKEALIMTNFPPGSLVSVQRNPLRHYGRLSLDFISPPPGEARLTSDVELPLLHGKVLGYYRMLAHPFPPSPLYKNRALLLLSPHRAVFVDLENIARISPAAPPPPIEPL